MNIGILALQGGYLAHAAQLQQLGIDWRFVKDSEALDTVDGLILPGGESSVCLRLLQANGLFERLQTFSKPILGTCAGAILLAKQVLAPEQTSLGRIDITLTRNAYGRQLASRMATGTWHSADGPKNLEMAFIRAPKITTLASHTGVKVIAECEGKPVAVQQGNCLASCFHPELTGEQTVHQYFIELIQKDLKETF